MPDDWRDLYRIYRSWSNPDTLIPHPHSPAARTYDYQSAMGRGPNPVARQFQKIVTKEELARLRQDPYSFKNAPILAKALRIYLEADTTPPEERNKVMLRNLSLATGYALGLGQNTTKALSGDQVHSNKIWEEMPGNALAVAGWSLKAFHEFRTVAAESKGFREWLESEQAAKGLAGDDLNVEAAFAESAAYDVGEVKQISRVRTTASGRQLMSLDAITLTATQREAAKAIHGKTMSGSLLAAWRNTSDAIEIEEMNKVKRLWNLGAPQAQQEARKLAVKMYNRHRDFFWAAVKSEAKARDAFGHAGMKFSGSRTGAPYYELPDGTKACMSLEHTVRKTDNPLLAVTGENLQFVLVDENSYFLEWIRRNDQFQY
jgi:hypothetical protein